MTSTHPVPDFEDSLRELAVLNARSEAARDTLRREVRVHIDDLLVKTGLSIEVLYPEKAAPATVTSPHPKKRGKKAKDPVYQDPDTGKTWSGQGHSPGFVRAWQEREGADAMDRLLIHGKTHSLGVARWIESRKG